MSDPMGEGGQFRHMMDRWESSHAGSYSGWSPNGPSMKAKQTIPTPSEDPKSTDASRSDSDSSRAVVIAIVGGLAIWILSKK